MIPLSVFVVLAPFVILSIVTDLLLWFIIFLIVDLFKWFRTFVHVVSDHIFQIIVAGDGAGQFGLVKLLEIAFASSINNELCLGQNVKVVVVVNNDQSLVEITENLSSAFRVFYFARQKSSPELVLTPVIFLVNVGQIDIIVGYGNKEVVTISEILERSRAGQCVLAADLRFVSPDNESGQSAVIVWLRNVLEIPINEIVNLRSSWINFFLGILWDWSLDEAGWVSVVLSRVVWIDPEFVAVGLNEDSWVSGQNVLFAFFVVVEPIDHNQNVDLFSDVDFVDRGIFPTDDIDIEPFVFFIIFDDWGNFVIQAQIVLFVINDRWNSKWAKFETVVFLNDLKDPVSNCCSWSSLLNDDEVSVGVQKVKGVRLLAELQIPDFFVLVDDSDLDVSVLSVDFVRVVVILIDIDPNLFPEDFIGTGLSLEEGLDETVDGTQK